VDERALQTLIESVRVGEVAPDEAVARLRRQPFADLGYAKVDHDRAERQGHAEVVYSPGKTPAECAGIVTELRNAAAGPVLVTRADAAQVGAVRAAHPDVIESGGQPATLVLDPAPPRVDRVALVTAGTADGPVAAECGATLEAHGLTPLRLYDVGVAGLHRLLDGLDELRQVDAVIVVAGMEGALASVVGGLVAVPVVAVPTSVGYGASLEGVTALLGMLASCAAGVTVVGIDNGFGAAAAVLRLLPTGTRPPMGADPSSHAGTVTGGAR
jgi:NCAIR mutase (PurE)-related protein